MPARVKICGIARTEDARLAVEAGADFLGCILFPPSRRAIAPADVPAVLDAVRGKVATVALVVDADDALIEEAAGAGFDWIQMHGSETPERVAEVRDRTGLSVMKAIGVREAGDLDAIARYRGVADKLLIDAKPPKGAAVPGGHGVAFDWQLIADRAWDVPWMLAGGLTAENVAEAIRLTGATEVDVASGTEASPGRKDPARLRAFIAAAKG